MVQREVLIHNSAGLHARPAALLVALAAGSKAQVTLQYGGKTINAKSILSVLGGGIGKGARVVVTADGEDEQATVDGICSLFEQFAEQRG